MNIVQIVLSDRLEHYSSGTEGIPKPRRATILFAVQKLWEAKIMSKITLDDISGKFWISKQHLLKLYKQQFGTTPYAHMMDLEN